MPLMTYVVDDEKIQRDFVTAQLAQQNIDVRTFSNGYDLLTALREESARPDVILADMMMPGMDGISLITTLKQLEPNIPVVMLTGHGSIQSAVDAMKAGAADFVTKPIDAARLDITLRHAAERNALRTEVARLSRHIAHKTDFSDLIGGSTAMQKLTTQLQRAAASDITVCLHGQSGTGKELIARAIHANSARINGPFVVVDCGAIPATLIESTLFGHERGAFTGATEKRTGKFQEADTGTLFLDEIGELDMSAQTRLLRVLQEREVEAIGSSGKPVKVNIRLVTATHRNLQNMVKSGAFREDLYYRIHVLPISVPALEERREDIPALALHFITRFCAQEGIPRKSLTAAARDWLVAQPWPGNVRQLENMIHRAVIMGDNPRIDIEDFTLGASSSPPGLLDVFGIYEPEFLPTMEELQQAYIDHITQRTGGNLSRTAKILGIGRTTLYRQRPVKPLKK